MTGKELRWMASYSILVVLLAVASIRPVHAQAQTKDFNVPAQSATTGIPEFARQAGIQILVSEPLVRDKKVAAVAGSHSVAEALSILLKGTGLVATTKDGATYTVAAMTSPSTQQRGTHNSLPESARVAQVDQTPAGPQAVEKNKGEESDSKKKTAGLEEIVVTGSRIPVAAGQETAQPVQIYSREDISRSGQTTVADFLNTLPDVSMNNVEGNNQNFLGRTTVQLHGLPAGTTLTLLNGRQTETGYYGGFFDLGAIPAAAIERIEVLPVGSSAVYGSDALGGAVNMILRKDFDGLEFNAKYGRDTGSGEDDFSLAWGKTWDQGSISLVANYQGRSELLGRDRSITSTTDVPAAASFLLIDGCSPGTVYSLNGQPLPGLGTATQAGIPAGIAGTPTLQSFQATAGKINLCNPNLDIAQIPTTHREGALLAGHYEISDGADLFTEVLFSHEFQAIAVGDAIGAYGGSFGYTTIGAGNPYNPFGAAVGVSNAYTGIPASYDNWQTFVRPLVGIRGSLGGGLEIRSHDAALPGQGARPGFVPKSKQPAGCS
jgi:iron complex outermembrane receptor protein